MGREKARMAIYSLAGIYLFTLAYQMIKEVQTAGTERTALIIFTGVFILAGAALIGMGIRHTYKISKSIVKDKK